MIHKFCTTFILLVLTSSIASATTKNFANVNRDPFLSPTSTTKDTDTAEKILIHLHYADAESIAKLLTNNKNPLLSPSGFINIDKRSNSLWIEDYAINLNNIEKFIADFDHPSKQIQIEARIVSADENFTKELGLEFGTIKKFDGKNGNLNMNFPDALDPGHFDFAIAKLSNDIILDMELSALESEGHGKIISRPKLVTIDRMPAYIASGDEIPYQEKTGEGNTSISFKKAVLSLAVTPELLTTSQILLHLNINQDKVSPLLYNGQPAISTRTIKTQAVVENNETIVLGGVYEESLDYLTESLPIISKIPIIGKIFTFKKNIRQRKELLIFITPKIITN